MANEPKDKVWPYIMVDIETTGNIPGSVILSIGAVCFDQKQVGPHFYSVIGRGSCLDVGLFETKDTLEWWDKQSEAARKVLDDAESKGAPKLEFVLNRFTNWLKQKTSPSKVCVFGNGSDFDNAFMAVAYHKCGLEMPWKFWNNACYRTLKRNSPIKIDHSGGTHHNALDDAKAQAEHLIKIWEMRK